MFKEFAILLAIGLPFVLGSVELGMHVGMAMDKERAPVKIKKQDDSTITFISPGFNCYCPTSPDAGKPVKGN